MTAKAFNESLFRKRVAHADNPNLPERHAFIDQAVKQCADAGLRFIEACAEMCGGDSDLVTRLADAENEIEERKREMVEIIDRYEAKLMEKQIKEPASNEGLKSFIALTWSYPQCRMVMLSLAVAGAMLTTERSILIACCAVALWMLLMWATIEQANEGYGPLIIKCLVLGSGFVFSWMNHDFYILSGTGLLLSFRLIENSMKWISERPVVSTVLEWVL